MFLKRKFDKIQVRKIASDKIKYFRFFYISV